MPNTNELVSRCEQIRRAYGLEVKDMATMVGMFAAFNRPGACVEPHDPDEDPDDSPEPYAVARRRLREHLNSLPSDIDVVPLLAAARAHYYGLVGWDAPRTHAH